MVEITEIDRDGNWGYPSAPGTKFNEGYLKRPDGHEIYFAEYGNPNGEPVFYLHGGPGDGTRPASSRYFDPAHYRIILFDQRGCGKSKPNVNDDLTGALKNNDTPHLVEDIEALRMYLKLGSTHIFGGSWGTTLGLAYALEHPEHVKSLVLRGIFTCTRRDLDYFYQGNAAQYDPGNPGDHTEKEGAYRAYLEDGKDHYMIPRNVRDPKMAEAYARAWDEYVTVIPKAERGDMVAAYHHILNSPEVDPALRLRAAMAWTMWEGVTSHLSHDASPEAMGQFVDQKYAVPFATIENHYFMNGVFLDGTDRNQQTLLDPEQLKKLAGIPIHIVHGKYDQVCPVYQAENLVKSLWLAGIEPNVTYTEMGHSQFERDTNPWLIATMDQLRDQQRGATNFTDKIKRDSGTRSI